MARRPRTLDAGDRGRQALRPGRRGRRLRGVLRIGGAARVAAGEPGARARGDPHRMLRGERQLRPSGLPRGARAAHRHARPRRRAGLGLRQLRPALGHDVAAGARQRRSQRRGADRRRPLRRRERRGPGERAHRAPAPRAARRRAKRRGEAVGLPCPDSCGAQRAGQARRGGAGRGDLAQVPVREGHAADDLRPRRPGAQPDLAADARRHRRRGPARAGERRQRAAAEDRAGAVAAPAADVEGHKRRARLRRPADPPGGA